jgi:hypothetical protein
MGGGQDEASGQTVLRDVHSQRRTGAIDGIPLIGLNYNIGSAYLILTDLISDLSNFRYEIFPAISASIEH